MSHPAEPLLHFHESVRIKQHEWSHLLEINELSVPQLPPCPLSIPNQLFLASIWLKDAVKGRNVDFPQNEYQLSCYYITRSHPFLVFYSIVSFFHLILPFLEQPYCAWSSHQQDHYDYNNPPFNPHYLSPHTVAILSFFCLLVYLIEIFMRLSVNFHHRKQRALDFWTKVRLVFVIVMIIDALVAMIAYSPQVLRALLPLIYITRRKSLRQMTSGLFLAASKCTSVFILLLCIILAWSYLGSMIFGQIELDVSGRFGSLLQSFLTTLESYSCRGYIIFALDPLFEVNAGTATYFVTLSIFADILCSALVIATGTRQYQLYAAKIFKKELLNRKQSMLAVFGVLYHCTKELEQSKSQEIAGTRENSRVDVRNNSFFSVDSFFEVEIISPHFRQSLYNPHVDSKEANQYISKEIWLAFCSQLRGRYEMSPELAAMLYDSEVLPGAKGLTREGLFNLAALLDGHIKIEGAIPTGSSMEGIERDDAGQIEAMPGRSVSITERLKEFSVPYTATKVSDEPGIMLSTINGSSKSKSTNIISSTLKEISHHSSVTKLRNRFRIFRAHYCQTCTQIMRASWILPRSIPLVSDTLNYFETAVFIARVLLIFQLVYMAKPSAPHGWLYFGWFLEIFFWVEMFIRLGGSAGWSMHHYTRLLGINLITFALMISAGTKSKLTGAKIALICFQWIRLIRVFLPFNASKALRTLLPLLFRVMFLVFTVIYFFANIGYLRFCNSFDAEEAAKVDDWAERWVPYEKQLNFNTMAQTMYTLFEVAILGNWSFVMRAAMLANAPPAAIFFYSYRLVMTLVVLPILTSFVIQAYNTRSTRLDEIEQEKKRLIEATRSPSTQRPQSTSNPAGTVSGAAVVNTLHDETGTTQRGTQVSDVSSSSMDTNGTTPSSTSTTIISRVEETENSMISFWSGSGNENYSANSSKPVRRRSSIQAPDGTIIVLTPEEVEQRLQAALNSLEVYKTKAENLMKENQELKLRLQEVQEVLEFDDDPEKDYT